ncbi:Beta-alanine--pyruvate aminotransferase [Methylobacterium crusticola]|uniref:Beta-alanine--pyruvate aminotransferase n=1 Tax=Methylobacterium crusticola TaxID=1697972 RepID=A0ABQ4R5W7_9HYPH|nr:aminotransferase class III-fold pyridoxal phosphate-dependent enzyme [Methylobacterium crusticola]GJD52539.1 Beta-alanine--pyruvate aminotransferase [Methylobacterium crusticola]
MNAPLKRSLPNAADAFWMPFSPMRAFNEQPLLFDRADGMHYVTPDGWRVLDGMAGLWCVNAGHAQPRITEAIREAAGRLDFVSSFKMTHPAARSYAQRLCAFAPDGIERVFFVNSGSEAVDTALKIARAYHHARGRSARTKLIGRAKGYHGMGFGGLSVAGIGRHKQDFGPLLPDVAHLPLPYDRETMAFSRGLPDGGLAAADALEELVQIHDPATVAAVIVEPVTGSGGVYPPPRGYLARLREICDRHGILLIFDEVITGFGRLGTPFAAQAYGVTPDLITCAKGMTNGAVPMGGVLVSEGVYDAFMAGPPEAIELFHGYTYSAHPLACAAGHAMLDVFEQDDLLGRLNAVLPVWQEGALRLRSSPHVVDVRTAGLLCAVELAPRAGVAGARGQQTYQRCLDDGLLVRSSGDTIVLSPPLIAGEDDVETIFATIGAALAPTA